MNIRCETCGREVVRTPQACRDQRSPMVRVCDGQRAARPLPIPLSLTLALCHATLGVPAGTFINVTPLKARPCLTRSLVPRNVGRWEQMAWMNSIDESDTAWEITPKILIPMGHFSSQLCAQQFQSDNQHIQLYCAPLIISLSTKHPSRVSSFSSPLS